MGLLTAPRVAFRIGILTFIMFGLTLAVPPGALPPGGHLPLSWMWSWLDTGPAFALKKPPVPVQEHGTAKGRAHHVAADATRSRGGAGTAPGHAPGALPEYTLPGQSRKPTTTPTVGVFDPKTSRMMPEKSGRGSTVYQNADGSLTRHVYDHAVNYRAADGTWRPIDTALVNRAGRLHATANSLDTSMASRVGGAAGQPLASLTLPSGQVIGYDLDGAAAVTPKVHDSTAVYGEILPETDLELTAFGSGLKETLILRSPDAPSSWLFPLHLKGVTPAQTDDGSVALLDSAGKVVARFPKGSMQDSKVQLPTGEPTSSDKVAYQLVEAAGGPALKVTADRAWLDDPARVYPVRVDPTSATDATGDAYVDNDPNTGSAQQNGNSLAVGTDGQPARSFIRFDGFSSEGFAGTHITAARLRLFHTWSWDCTSHYPIYVHKVTEPWSPAGLSTSSLPGPATTSAIGSLTITDNYPACTNTSADRSVGNWWWVDLNPGAFNDWSTGGANNGLAITANESDTKGWKRFTAANYAYGSYSAYLELTYTYNVPPQVDAQYPTHGYASPTLTPELLASAQDPDGWPKSLTYDFVVYDKAGAKIADSGFVPSRSWVVPASKLTWGETYFWTVVASDGVYGSTSQTTNMLTTPVPQPLITSRLSPNGDKGFDADSGNYTTTVTDAAVATVGPALSVQRFYNSLDPRSGAFGSGWASMADARATESRDASGTLQTVVVTYPSGQDVAFGRNSDGTFSPPSGRFSSFVPVTGGGYKLTDKDATAYSFTRPTGAAANAIPMEGEAEGTLRCLDAGAWEASAGLVPALARQIVAPFGVTVDVEVRRGVPPVVNEPLAVSVMHQAVSSTLGADAVASTEQSLGGEDFAWYLTKISGAMARLGVRAPGGTAPLDLHQGTFDVDEQAISVGSRVLVAAAVLAGSGR